MALTPPLPRDPGQPQWQPEDVRRHITRVLSEDGDPLVGQLPDTVAPEADLAELVELLAGYARRLDRAQEILGDALDDNAPPPQHAD